MSLNKIKQKLESKKITLINAKRIEDAKKQITNIHKQNEDDVCYIAIATKEKPTKRFNQWHVKYSDLSWNNLSNLLGLDDIYISLSSSYKCSRKIRDIRHLNAFWVDLDYYNIKKYKKKTAVEMIEILRKKKLFNDLEPSCFVDSGNGMYILYLIEECPKQLLKYWQIIQNTLTDRFKEYGADEKSTDAVHILRLAGSVNSKTGRISTYIPNNNEPRKYKITEIGDIVLPKLDFTKEEWKKLKKERAIEIKKKKERLETKQKAKVYSLYNIFTLNQARMEDIEKLVEIRKGECNGMRELLCFLYRYYSCCFYKNPATAIDAVKELNNNFLEPLTESELLKATKSGELSWNLWEKTYRDYLALDIAPNKITFFRKAGCYIYSNKKLIDLLEITSEEMQQLKTIIDTQEKNRRAKDYQKQWKIDNKEKWNYYQNFYRKDKRRNKNGLTSREQAKDDRLKRIEKMLKEGVKQVEIAKILGISKSTVSAYKTKINSSKNTTSTISISHIDNHLNDLYERVNQADIEALIC